MGTDTGATRASVRGTPSLYERVLITRTCTELLLFARHGSKCFPSSSQLSPPINEGSTLITLSEKSTDFPKLTKVVQGRTGTRSEIYLISKCITLRIVGSPFYQHPRHWAPLVLSSISTLLLALVPIHPYRSLDTNSPWSLLIHLLTKYRVCTSVLSHELGTGCRAINQTYITYPLGAHSPGRKIIAQAVPSVWWRMGWWEAECREAQSRWHLGYLEERPLHLKPEEWEVVWDFLVAQWLRIRLPVQGTWVGALVREDPTCCGAPKPVHHNYWACALEPASHNYWAHVPQLLDPVRLEPMLRNKRSHCNAKPAHCNEE